MLDGICPKCNLPTVHTTVEIKGRAIDRVSVTMWSFADLDYYVCVNCGYVERYIGETEKLREIAEKWPRVSPASPDDGEQNTRRLR